MFGSRFHSEYPRIRITVPRGIYHFRTAIWLWYSHFINRHRVPYWFLQATQIDVQASPYNSYHPLPGLDSAYICWGFCSEKWALVYHFRYHRVPCVYMVYTFIHSIRTICGPQNLWHGLEDDGLFSLHYCLWYLPLCLFWNEVSTVSYTSNACPMLFWTVFNYIYCLAVLSGCHIKVRVWRSDKRDHSTESREAYESETIVHL